MISENPAVPASSISTSRFRYREEAPEFIAVSASELLDRLPREFRGEGDANGRNISLPCRDLLVGNIPRLSLGQLRDLVPELIHLPEGTDQGRQVPLPPGWVALHYHLITKLEELPAEKIPEPPTSSIAVSEANPTIIESSGTMESNAVSAANNPPAEGNQLPDGKSAEEVIPPGASEIIKAQVTPETDPSPSPKRSFFSLLLNFRRHQKAAQLLTPVDANPEVSQVEKADSQTSLSRGSGSEQVSTEKMDSSSILTLDHLWKLDPQDQIADSSSLQALFMTEEKLTLDRVIAMAGQLPGLRTCVLAHGDQVVCAPNTQPGVDLQTLSGQAMIMLTQIRESSAKMGIGSVPAVTLHADQGVLSFLHNGELCLLVLHADRGFVPGVRERLQEMLFHISTAKALPGASSAQASLPI